MNEVPAYIADRIRRPVPANSFVIPNSTPIISFGNVHTATVATLGLNPSKREFATAKGEWLIGPLRRLATYDSLEVDLLTNADDHVIQSVVDDCYKYFEKQPYMTWFRPLDTLLRDATSTSYMNGTACHLDLVQWATEPVWQHLPLSVKSELIDSDREFLNEQLNNEQIELVLMNGKSVIEQVRAMNIELKELEPLHKDKLKCGFSAGHRNGTLFLGWSLNLQSSFGVSNAFKSELAEKVEHLITSFGQKRA